MAASGEGKNPVSSPVIISFKKFKLSMSSENITELWNTAEVASLKTKGEKALYLMKHHNFSRTEIVSAGLCPASSRCRALQAAEKGYQIGQNGNRQKLSSTDESILTSWIQEFLSQGETMYTWKIISLVCTYSFPH